MRHYLLVTLLVSITSTFGIAQKNIWVVSNISLNDPIVLTDIIENPDIGNKDVIVFHGNALKESKSLLDDQVAKLKNNFERVYIVPGNEDWEKFKSEDLKDLGDFLDDEFKGDVIVPENGCGAIEVKDINDDLAMVFIDSEWYFRNWEDDSSINRNCEVTSRSNFWSELRGEIGKLKAKQILLFARHPLLRFDEESPKKSLTDHIFPLQQFIPGFYLPLPVVGTLISDTKLHFTPGSSLMSPKYQAYIDEFDNLLDFHPQITMVTSDAQSNYIGKKNEHFLININSSREMDDQVREDLLHTFNTRGVLQLTVEDQQVHAVLIDSYSKKKTNFKVQDGRPLEERLDGLNLKQVDQDALITRKIRLDEDMVHFNTTIFGKLNKKFYYNEVTAPVLDLRSAKGGLTPVRLGGGMQTQSLRLRADDGQIYLARSLKKRPQKALPPSMNHKILHPVMDHFFYGGQPLGALATSTLDSAIGVYHTTPELMYLPRQELLGEYNSEIGGELVLFRERADNAWENKKSFGYSKDIIGSKDMISEMNNNKGIPQKEEYLRARLLDLVLGDWDRHQDQWRWAKDTSDLALDIYHPIARDRDQVFANFNGFILNLVRPYSPNMLQLRSYDKKLTRSEIKWMHWKSSFLDNTVLHFLEEEEWRTETATTKSSLTPDVLQAAVDNFPDSYGKEKQRIKDIMAARVENLDEISENLRLELLDHGLVRASDDNDSIVIKQFEDKIHIKITGDFDGKNRTIKFDGYFYEKWTSRVWIYALEGKDVISVSGMDNSSIDITLIGGYDKDTFISNEKIKNLTIIDDNPKDEVSMGTQSKYRMITDKSVHDLERFDLVPQYRFILPLLGYNTDDGFKLGAEYTWNNTGFKSTNTHKIGGSYLTNRRSSGFYYKYQSYDALDNRGRYFNADWSGPRRQLNYFGGNDAINNNDNNFYDVFMSDYRIEYGGLKQINPISQINAGAYVWSAEVEESENNYVNIDEDINPEVFDSQFFVGGKANLELKNYDDLFKITQGARLLIGADTRYNINQESINLKLQLEYDYYKPLIGDNRLIFSTKLRLGHIFGDYYFYEGFQIGGFNTLRGFRNGRYTGRTLVANNINLHLKILDEIFDGFLPGSFGISGSFDNGRVWTDEDDSDQWHYSYGAGVWFSPLDVTVLSLGFHQSKEDNQLRLLFNWQF